MKKTRENDYPNCLTSQPLLGLHYPLSALKKMLSFTVVVCPRSSIDIVEHTVFAIISVVFVFFFIIFRVSLSLSLLATYTHKHRQTDKCASCSKSIEPSEPYRVQPSSMLTRLVSLSGIQSNAVEDAV